jgi:hypothetical protein
MHLSAGCTLHGHPFKYSLIACFENYCAAFRLRKPTALTIPLSYHGSSLFVQSIESSSFRAFTLADSHCFNKMTDRVEQSSNTRTGEEPQDSDEGGATRRPILLRYRSSSWFILAVVCLAVFTVCVLSSMKKGSVAADYANLGWVSLLCCMCS